MKRLIIGTAGHIDHGKSALVKALTGVDPDRLKEEKERGITIDLGFAHLDLPGGVRAGIVDVPGHERFVRNMVAGAYGIDLLLLVIAADEGIMPQTREHLDICELLGVKRGVVALTKRDLVDDEWLEMIVQEVRDYLKGYSLSEAPIVPVSSITGEGIDELKEALGIVAKEVEGKEADNLLLYPVDRVFPVKGAGTVVTGTLFSGRIRVGDELVLLPGGVRCRVRGVQSHGQELGEAVAGMRAAVNLSGISREQAYRGCALTKSGEVLETTEIDASVVNLVVNRKPLSYGDRVSFHCGTARVEARLFPYGKEEIPPGKSGFARIKLDEPVAVLGGNRFILRGYSRLENFGYTVGGGVVLNPVPPKRSPARWGGVRGILEALSSGTDEERVRAALIESGTSGCTKIGISRITGMTPARAQEVLEALSSRKEVLEGEDGIFYHAPLIKEIGERIEGRVKELHLAEPLKEGFPVEEVASGLKDARSGAFSRALALLLEEGRLVKGEKGLLPSERGDAGADLLDKIEKIVLERGIEGPTPREISVETGIPEKDVRTVLSRLAREGKIKRARDFYFSSETVEEVAAKVREYLSEKGEMTVSQFRDLIGTTRKYAVPLVELMDQERVTLRRGDVRVLWKR